MKLLPTKKILDWLKAADDYTESAENSLRDLVRQIAGITGLLGALIAVLLAPINALTEHAKKYNIPTVEIPIPFDKNQKINILLAELGTALSANHVFFWVYQNEKSVILRYKNQWGFSSDEKYIASVPLSPQVSGAQLRRFHAHQKLLCFTVNISKLPKNSLLARQLKNRETKLQISCPVSFSVGKNLIVGAIAVEFEYEEIDEIEVLRALGKYAEELAAL